MDEPQYVAKAQIFHNNALAYNPGDPVPAPNVQAHGYERDGLVELVDDPGDGEAVPSPGPDFVEPPDPGQA